MNRLTVELQLTTEQKRAVGEMMMAGGACICGAELDSTSHRSLLAQPHSEKTENDDKSGTLEVIAFCCRCHELMMAAIKMCRESRVGRA